MDKTKNLLEKTYQHFMQVGFNELDSIILIDIADKSVMDFGTTFDGKAFYRNKAEEFSNSHHEKSDGMRIAGNSKLIPYHFSDGEISAIYVPLSTCSLYQYQISENRKKENILQIPFSKKKILQLKRTIDFIKILP